MRQGVAQEAQSAGPVRPPRNQLLDRLPPDEYRRLRPGLEAIPLRQGQLLYEAGARIHHVYFPSGAVVSLRAAMGTGATVEVATIGREGVLGLAACLADGTSSTRAVVQVAGGATRLRAASFREAGRGSPALLGLLLGYAQALTEQAMQLAACHRLHPLEQRAARWLLLLHGRVGPGPFPVTHELLAEVLGAGRPAVSVAAGMLRRAGAIHYHRGMVTVLDRAGLEAAACECYRVLRSSAERVPGTPP